MEGGIPVFDGEGYEIWRKKMKTLFRSLELWDLVEQGYEKKKDSDRMRELTKKDSKALYLIQQGVCNSIFHVIMNSKSSKSAWDAIRNKFDHIHFQKQQIEIAMPKIKRGTETEILTKDQVRDVTQKKCVFRVPDELRNGNEEFYEPKVLAIGPYHRGKPRLAAIEDHKKLYRKDLLQRMGKESVDNLVQAILQHEQRVRKCYDESYNITNLNSDELAQLMVLDGCFIIELFVRHGEKKVSHDQINYPNKIELIALQNDMLLIENQIPFFILQILFNNIFPTPPDNLIFITLRFFGKKLKRYGLSNYADWMYSDLIDNQDLLYHLLHIINKFLTSPFSPATSKQKSQINRFINQATKLEEANVKLKTKRSTSMFDITFNNGELEIPCWNINNQTEIEFRNLIAFEVCQQLPKERFFIDYVLFMNHLVTSSDDVNLLTSRDIFINHMISANAVDTMLRNLTKNVEMSKTYTYYKITKHLNIYCNRHRNKWIVSLKQKYFKNPWTIISLVAGFVILCLTAIQTVFTIK